MNWKKRVFENFKLYAVTDLSSEDASILPRIEQAFRGGADIIQLRSKILSDGALVRLGTAVRKIADRCQKLFFMNDRLDVALAAGADGLHLGQDDLPLGRARGLCRQAGASLWLGQSTHSLNQAIRAQEEGADYVAIGPLFQTPTKPDVPAVGLDLIREAKEKIKIPFLVIGGINEENLEVILRAGATRIAAVRAIFGAQDPYEANRKLREQIERFPQKVAA